MFWMGVFNTAMIVGFTCFVVKRSVFFSTLFSVENYVHHLV